MTSVGVDAGKLTAAYTSAYTSGINFNGVTGDSTLLTTAGHALSMPSATYVTANDAISALALHIGNLDGSFDGSPVGETPTQFVYAWTQTDGLLATSAKVVDASDLKATSKASDNLTATVLASNGITVTSTPTAKGVPAYAIDPVKTNVTTGTLQNAIDTIVTSVASTFASLDMAQVGAGVTTAPSAVTASENYAPYRIVNTVVQSDGYVSATDLALVAQTVGFKPIVSSATQIPVSGYTVGAALSSISKYIGSLDFTTDTAGAAPTSGGTTKYSIVNTVAQDNGLVSDTKIDLTAGNTYTAAIDGNLPDTNTSTKSSAAVRVAILADSTEQTDLAKAGKTGSVQLALDNISNILADYLSFHNAAGSVI